MLFFLAFRFTSEDIHGIHQCFQYTATVLTSTLAFQNERKLKDQTQVFVIAVVLMLKLVFLQSVIVLFNHKKVLVLFFIFFHEQLVNSKFVLIIKCQA